jgi:AcrR family transcriptional regulator
MDTSADPPIFEDPAPPSRERILDAAEQLMAERGFTATSIAAITAASDAPASSVYWHFTSKEGLLAAVIERAAERWVAGLGRARDLPGEPSARLTAFIASGLEDIARRPPEFMRLAVMLGIERSVTHPDGDCLQAIRRIRARGGALIAEAIEESYANAGESTARNIARACLPMAIAFIDGAFLAHQIDPAGTRLDRLAAQLDTALRAVAAEHLASTGAGAAK